MEEIWKDIPGYEGIYQASSFGNIRTCDGKITSNKRHGVRHWRSRILKGRGDNPKTGKRVNLWKYGKPKEFLVARLVALTFFGAPPDGYTVNHIDGNRFNNHIDNLEWLSRADNIRHGFTTGLYPTKHVFLRGDNRAILFPSMTKCDEYLRKNRGYTSDKLKKGCTLYDADGNQYTASVIPL